MTVQCAHCSSPVPDDSTYCHQCGSLVSDAEGQSAATKVMDASAAQKMKSLLQQDTEGEYVIERPLGKGGMAAV